MAGSVRSDGIYQFVPSILGDLRGADTVEHGGVRLRASYILDLMHGIIMRHNFCGSRRMRLSSQILKKTYGRNYRHYLGFLVGRGALRMVSDYSAGNRCRLYEVPPGVLGGGMARYLNTDGELVLKRAIRRHDLNDRNLIGTAMKMRLVDNLRRASIDYDSALSMLSDIDDPRTLNKNVHSIESIKDGNLFWHFDDYGRFHSNFTVIRSSVRKECLRIDGEPTLEVDIPNSQPLFFSWLARSHGGADPDELGRFSDIALGGRLYEHLSDRFGPSVTRSQVKKIVYRALFGRGGPTCHSTGMLSSVFPSMVAFASAYKRSRGDYRILAHDLQRAESDFVYNSVLAMVVDARPGMPFLTVHDSIIVKSSDLGIVETTLNQCMDRHFGLAGVNI